MMQQLQLYPSLGQDTQSLRDTLLRIIEQRNNIDVPTLNNLTTFFPFGFRHVRKVPTGSADIVTGEDRLGDINYDTDYLYLVVPDGSTGIEWGRLELEKW